MESLDQILYDIENKSLGTVLRKGEGDIDIYCITSEGIKDYFSDLGATMAFETDSKIGFYFFIDEKRILFDIEKNFEYVSDQFNNSFSIETKHSLADYNHNKLMFDTLRYIFSFKSNKKEFFEKNYKTLKKNNFYLSELTGNPFKRQFQNLDELHKFLSKDILVMFSLLKGKYLISHFFSRLFFHAGLVFKRLFSNNTYAILGYDGSGKTTISQILSGNFGVKSFYMGYRRYSERWYYNLLDSNNIFKLIRLVFMFVDFWMLYIQIFYAKIRYEFVIFDRHPKYEIYPHSDIAQRAISFLFFFYPAPRKNFILYNDPKIILSRKNERSKKEILDLNDYILSVLSQNKRNVIIKNNHIDDTLNDILTSLY